MSSDTEDIIKGVVMVGVSYMLIKSFFKYETKRLQIKGELCKRLVEREDGK